MSSWKPSKADYKRYYKKYHSSPEAIKDRSQHNRNRKDFGLKKGDGKEVDHIVSTSKGGSNARSNLRVVSRTTNRKKKDNPA